MVGLVYELVNIYIFFFFIQISSDMSSDIFIVVSSETVEKFVLRNVRRVC